MIRKGTIRSFDSVAYTATIQIEGSEGVWIHDMPVSRGIAAGEMTTGRKVAVVFFDESNPRDAVVAAVYTPH